MATTSSTFSPAARTQQHKVLHLVGSRQDSFYYDLSILYARACDACQELDRERYAFKFALVRMDDQWSFPDSLDEKDIEAAPRMSFAEAMMHIRIMAPSVMVPHMFCVEGMTRYRSLFDILQIPYVGNKEYTVWPATDKATTKQFLEANGVQVPKGDLLIKGENERPTSVKVPFVVKPCNEDNSRGITLVRTEEEAQKAIDYAFSFDERVVVDEYIAGREVRVACVEEEDGSLTVLPKLEYFLKDIRTSAHKLATDSSGKLTQDAIKQAKKDGDRKCPADLSPQLHERIDKVVKRAHHALKCRHYSLFDLRISEDEQPYILEACLFCSFSPLSVIPAMAAHAKEELRHPRYFHSLLERCITEGKTAEKAEEKKAEKAEEANEDSKFVGA
jgi:D-alanine-D-alanine ligase